MVGGLTLQLFVIGWMMCPIDVTPFPEVTIDTSQPYAVLSAKGDSTFADTKTSIEVTQNKDCSLTFRYEKVVIRVARELASNTCLREHLIAHERKHVLLYETTLDLFRNQLPILAQDLGLEKAFDVLWSKVKEEHRSLDTHEEYASNHQVCGGRLAGLLGYGNIVAFKGKFE